MTRRSLHFSPIQSADPDFRSALIAADLPIDDLDEPGRTFYSCTWDGVIVGFGGYELYGDDVLLRSIVVMPDRRGERLGRAIVETMVHDAGRKGARAAWLLTTTAEDFFNHLGFARVDRAAAPRSILGTRQATTICTTAALLTRTLI